MENILINENEITQQTTWEEWELEWWSKNLGISKEALLHSAGNAEVAIEETDLQIS